MSEEKREYLRKWRQKRKREKSGWITKAYGNMRSRNRSKFGIEMPFSKDEFISWLDTNYKEEFDRIFKAYVESNCDKYLAPSVDRLNDYEPYSLDNIRLTTWRENNEKGRASEKSKRQCGEMAKRVWSKKVGQYDLEGNLINTFPSTREAERSLGFVDSSAVARVCRGEKITHKGFKWRYLDHEEECIVE